jgi:hypothetical protein
MPTLRTLLVALLLAAMAGCGFAPMAVPDPSAIQPGPGLLSGKSGEFTIYGRR